MCSTIASRYNRKRLKGSLELNSTTKYVTISTTKASKEVANLEDSQHLNFKRTYIHIYMSEILF